MFGSVFLVSGTTIGAGMLAFPITTGIAGFFPALILFCIVWAFLLMTSFLFLEVNLCFDDKANLTTMAAHTLGKWGKWVCVVCYILLLYCLVAAYLSGATDIAHTFSEKVLPRWFFALVFVLVFGYSVYMGTSKVDMFNRIFIIGLIICYVAFVIFAFPHVELNLLVRFEPKFLWLSLNVIITAFGYHIIIPTLKEYLKGDIKALKLSIFIGSIVPLFVYVLWNFLFLSILPKQIIIEAFGAGSLPIEPIKNLLQVPSITLFASLLAFFVIVTSFLGVTLSLSDFLADLFKVKKNKSGKLILALITFMPPLVFVLSGQRGFYTALGYGGAFVAILLGILPCLMAMKHRKQRKQLPYRAPVNSFMMWIAILFFAMVVVVNILQQIDVISLERLMQ